jgi:hypothetical protein
MKLVFLGCSETESTQYVGHYLAYCVSPQMMDKCGAVGEMRIGRGDLSALRKPAPLLFCPPQIPYDLTRAAMVGSRRLTAWARGRIRHKVYQTSKKPSYDKPEMGLVQHPTIKDSSGSFMLWLPCPHRTSPWPITDTHCTGHLLYNRVTTGITESYTCICDPSNLNSKR